MRGWVSAHPEWRAQNATHHRTKYQELKEQVYILLGNKCAVCGFDDVRALQIDHVAGNGNTDRRSKTGAKRSTGYGYTFFKKILADPDAKNKYQILCANHNWIKRVENKEFARGDS